MDLTRQTAQQVSEEYDVFLKDAATLSSDYGENNIHEYLLMYRARILSQISTQLRIITRDGLENGKILSLGGWPGVAPIILSRITGMNGTILDHPALLTKTMRHFYTEQGLETVEFDFADAANKPMPVEGPFDLIECCQCIEHWNFSPIPVFRQIFSNLLAPRGSLFVTVPNATSLYRRLAVLLGRSPYPRMEDFIDTDNRKSGAEVSPHWREYMRKDLELLARHCGGYCAKLCTASYPIANKQSWLHKFYFMLSLAHPLLRENIEGVCKLK